MSDELTQNYAGAFDGRLPFGQRPALLVIDLVLAYVTPGSPLYAGPGVADVMACTERLIAAARAAR